MSKSTLKYLIQFIGSLFIIQIAISLWTEKGIDWTTFIALSIGAVIGVVILELIKKDLKKTNSDL
ncbi:hypothetical protein [Bacillus sp. AK031]